MARPSAWSTAAGERTWYARGSESFPNSDEDPRVVRMRDPSGTGPWLCQCDACGEFRDYHIVLYARHAGASSLLECAHCHAYRTCVPMHEAKRIFKSRTGPQMTHK